MVEVRPAAGVSFEDRFSDRSLVASGETGRSSISRDSFIPVPSQLVTTQGPSQEEAEGDRLKKALVVAGVAVAGAAAIAGAYILLRRVDPGAVAGGLKRLVQGIVTLRPGIAAPLFLKGLAAGVSAVSATLLLKHFIARDGADDQSHSASYRSRTDLSPFRPPIIFSNRPIESFPDTRVVQVAPQQKQGGGARVLPTHRALSGTASPRNFSVLTAGTDNAGRRQASLTGRVGSAELLLGRDGLRGDPFFRDSRPVATWVMTSPRNPESLQVFSPESVPAQGIVGREAQPSRHRGSIGSLRASSVAENGGRSRDQKGEEGRLPERERVADLIRRGSGSYLVTVPSRGADTDHSVLASPFSPLVAATFSLVRRPETAEISALADHQVVLVSKGETAPLLTNQIKGRSVGKSGESVGSAKRSARLKGLIGADHDLGEIYPTVLFSPPELAPRLVYSPLDLEAIRMPPGTDFSPQLEKVAQVTEYELSLDELPEDQPEIPESEELVEATQEEGDGSHRQQNGEEEAAEEDSIA